MTGPRPPQHWHPARRQHPPKRPRAPGPATRASALSKFHPIRIMTGAQLRCTALARWASLIAGASMHVKQLPAAKQHMNSLAFKLSHAFAFSSSSRMAGEFEAQGPRAPATPRWCPSPVLELGALGAGSAGLQRAMGGWWSHARGLC